MHYLDILSSLRPKYRLAKGDDHLGYTPETGIDHHPSVPPTLQDNGDLTNQFGHAIDEQTGFLTVNPDGAHPIFQLVSTAEKRWKDKLARASKTLDEAVKEYQRRYNRLPPRGFDDWWAYVQEHNVQLPDEYDTIHEDLEIYWGHSPADLRQLQREREALPTTYTIGKVGANDPVKLLNMTVENVEGKVAEVTKYGSNPQLKLLEEIGDKIPPFRATMRFDDRPGMLTDWAWKNTAMKAIKEGKCELTTSL